MCGIYGSIGCGASLEASLACLRTLAHRGPDGEGYHSDPAHDVFLGHTRLSIVDLSPAGAQPMPNEDKSLWLVLNGEIYNHRALRRELIAKGHRFIGRCDAEVVLHLYEEHGERLLERLTGMFAFALWDLKARRLMLARDRIGIKPLFYALGGGTLAFSSELKALAITPGLDLTPDVTAYWDFLTYQFVPAPKTVYRAARKLPAGHLALFAAGRLEVRRWWEPRFDPDPAMTEERAIDELDALLDEVVSDHLLADVPVGLFLSGGVDSSLVAARVARATREPTSAFSIRFPDRPHDEAAIAAATARRLGFAWHVQEFGADDLLALVPTIPDLFDEPFGDQAALPMVGLARMTARKVKVVLSGDGGDETHLGYPRYFKERERRALHLLADALPAKRLLRRTSLRNTLEGPWGRMCHFYGGIPAHTKRAFAEVVAPELRDYDDYWLYKQHDRPELPPLARQQAIDFATWLVEGILTKVDRTSMRFGLEVRPPLLDHRVVGLATRIPDAVLAKDGVPKHLLKRLLERELPREIVHRRKTAFSVPLKQFIHERGLLRPERDLDVLGAFRIRREKVEHALSTSRDHHSYWLLAQLAAFVQREAVTASP